MISLRIPPLPSRDELSDDRRARTQLGPSGSNLARDALRNGLLLGSRVVNPRAVLCAGVAVLPVERGGVVDAVKVEDQRLRRYHLGIKLDLHGLSVPGLA